MAAALRIFRSMSRLESLPQVAKYVAPSEALCMKSSVTGAISTHTEPISSSSATMDASEGKAPCHDSVVRENTLTAPSGAIRIHPLRRIGADGRAFGDRL